MSTTTLLDGQWAPAIEDTDGPQLVLAGPGTGKTEFLARRVAHLIARGVPTAHLAVLTFSRRAAAELESRISACLDRPRSGAAATTFHSFAHRIVEAARAAAGEAMPVLLTGPEQVRLVARTLAEEDPADWPAAFRPMLTTATFAAEAADFVMRCNERLLDADALAELAAARADWAAMPGFLSRYRRRLAAEGRIDYGALIVEAVACAPDVADQFAYVIVDEYQDTTPAQARLAETVTRTGNVTVAADPRQSVYAFRGADLDNVESFDRRLGGAKVVALAQSQRVPRPVLESARRLLAPEPPTSLPRLEVLPAPHDGSVEAYLFDQRSAEAEWIAAEVERLHAVDKLALASIAVLVRSTRYLLPELSRALGRRHIPHDRADRRLVDEPGIRLVFDAVTAALAPAGSPERDRAAVRLLLGPLVELPLGRQRQIERERRRQGLDWPDAIRRHLPDATALADLIEDGDWAVTPPAVDGFWHLWDRLPHLDRLVADPAGRGYRAAWSTFARMLERQAERDASVSLAESLDTTFSGEFEASPLLSFTRPDEDRLAVTTLHQAKGLEFDVVFIADAIEGVFPDTRRWRALLQPDLLGEDAHSRTLSRLAEERRLAYTATTRARRRVVWTATTAGIEEGERRPSRFMLAAVGAESFDDLGRPPSAPRQGFSPLTVTEAQATLRRQLADPAAGSADRLASLAVLADPRHPWEAEWFSGVPEPGPDTGVIVGSPRLSPSQASLYASCPRRYVLERRLGASDNQSPYLLFGSIIHAVLEEAEKEAAAAGAGHADLDTALRHLEAVWEVHGNFGTPALDDHWHRRAEELLEETYANWPGGDQPAIALEIELPATIGDVAWTGRADRVEPAPGGVRIVDYKTSRNPPTFKDAARSLQLGYYVLAAAAHPGVSRHGPPVAAELWFPFADGKKVRAFDVGLLPEVEKELVEVAQGVAREDWTPRVSRDCERCDFKLVCPAWPDGREAG